MVKPVKKASNGGRPSVKQAAALRALILETGRRLFLTQGYGATSIDAIAREAGISKRTFYARFTDKADLFSAVLKELIERLQQPQHAPLSRSRDCAEVLLQYAQAILKAVVQPEALAMQRLMLAEAGRFPELAASLEANGARQEALRRIADLLQHHRAITREDAAFAAEEFLYMVIAVPQRRAMGLGVALSASELDAWAARAVQLFLHGYLGTRAD